MERNKKYEWHKIADTKNDFLFPENNLLPIAVAGKQLCLAKINDKLFACTSKCPHAGGLIANGFIDALNNIVCPLHRYKFNVENGRNVSGEGYYLKTFPIDERDDGIYIGIESGSFFSWL